VNYSSLAREHGLILHTTVGIGYETPWRQVEAMLLMAADRTAQVPEGAEAVRAAASLGDFAVVYELNVYTSGPGMNRVYTELHRNILDVFNEYGVQIMTPAYVQDPEVPKLVPKEQWFLAPGAEVPAAVPREPPGAAVGSRTRPAATAFAAMPSREA
jgi:small-conductance mechanosensitive channel